MFQRKPSRSLSMIIFTILLVTYYLGQRLLVVDDLWTRTSDGQPTVNVEEHAPPQASMPMFCPSTIDPADYSARAIKCRIKAARLRSREMNTAQSTTPAQAVVEYRRRYNREPPFGFTQWVEFALQHESKIIDDFDQIDRDLLPFRSDEGKQVVSQMLARNDWNNLRRVDFVEGDMKISGIAGYAYGGHWDKLTGPFMHAIPNGTAVWMSTIDEPRVLAKAGAPPAELTFENRARQNLEDLIVESCEQLPRDLTARLGKEKDVCQIEEPSKIHGFVASPDTFAFTRSLAPILSIGRMSAFRDVLIPCPCYVGHPVLENDPTPFHKKKPSVYWRGSSTGLRNLKTTWMYGHRQRFVSFVQSLQQTAKLLGTSRFFGIDPSAAEKKQIQLFERVFDVGMGGYLQCEDEGDKSVCEEMEKHLGHSTWQPEDTSLEHRYVFDVDGNSMSTRFYRLLSRQSVVLKETLFQEWHDDRLIPWMHYVPVSMQMEELPALMTFLVTDPEGEALSAEIAHAGYTWSRQTLRDIDMSIYIYRLLLEMSDIFKDVK